MKSLPADFSASDYLRLNPDVASAGLDATHHYLEFGQAEGRMYTDSRTEKEYLISTGIFDPEFYLKQYPDVTEAGIDPYEHFLNSGCAEGRWASVFFRSDWYMERYPSAKRHAKNSLFHYVEIGSKLGYEPNPFFESAYYLQKYRKQLDGKEPLAHFIKYGAEGFNPSPRFDARAYVEETGCIGNPLKHYLEFGMQAGVPLRRAEPLKWGEQVESAFLRVVKCSDPVKRVALLITHSRDGTIKPHVHYYANQLVSGGSSVFLIVASDFGCVAVPEELHNICSNIVVRQNIGYDFAAWAHVMKAFSWISDCTEIILTNDSIVGPVGISGLEFMDIVRSEPADIIGLIENHEHADHLQSFFLVLGERAIRAKGFKDFWLGVVNHADKSKVIRDYEITFTQCMRALDLKMACVYSKAGLNNATIFKWEQLLEEGFPFLKFEVIRNASADALELIRSRLLKMSFDTSLIPELN
ncbi:rhamnan synthesis F family protein [Pseudomonas syringae]|uniref:rhamnan synthesis F family protein n=1 Tax=Pseudomonas syringae TaxID=317 RepID=UPI003F753349